MNNDGKTPFSTNQSRVANFEPTFLGKVMFFFGLAILVSAGGVYISMQYFMQYFAQFSALIWLVFIAELAIVFTARIWSTKYPVNRLIFAFFAFLSGVTLAPLIVMVLQTSDGLMLLSKALVATTLMFTATAIIGMTTKVDLSGMRGFLLMALIGMIVVSVIGIFVPWGNTFEMIFSGIGVLLFSAFTVYDFNNLKYYPEDRYIDAALALYLDIFNLFVYILRLMLALNNRE